MRTILILLLACCTAGMRASDSLIHRLEASAMPSIPTKHHPFLRGHNSKGQSIDYATMLRLKYGHVTTNDTLYRGSQQGVGVGLHCFPSLLGTPVSAYFYQGAPIVRFSDKLALGYEWDLGLAAGLKYYNEEERENRLLGSSVNLYLTIDILLQIWLSEHFDLNVGIGYTHFSNANTVFPNEGLNSFGLSASLVWYSRRNKLPPVAAIPAVSERFYTDVVAQAGWKRRGKLHNGYGIYGLGGMSVTTCYRLFNIISLGAGADFIYDPTINDDTAFFQQLAVGLQARAELNMPIFRAFGGVGIFALGHMRGPYENIGVKIDVSRKLFLNVGYILYNWRYNNNMQIGMGLHL